MDLGRRLYMLAFESELANLPRPLIEAIWEALERLDLLDSQRQSVKLCGWEREAMFRRCHR